MPRGAGKCNVFRILAAETVTSQPFLVHSLFVVSERTIPDFGIARYGYQCPLSVGLPKAHESQPIYDQAAECGEGNG